MTTATSMDLEIGRTLADCALAARSGILTAVRGKLKRLFCLEEGSLALALSNVIEEQLSEVFVEDGLLSVGDLAEAQQSCEEQGLRLSRFLVDRQLVAENTMSRAIEAHVRKLLFSTMDWTDGEATWAHGQPDLQGELRVSLDCVPLLFEYAAERSLSLGELCSRLGPLREALDAREDRAALLTGHNPGAAAQHILSRVDGNASATDLVDAFPGDEEDAWRALYALRMLGLAEPSTKHRAGGAVKSETREQIEVELRRAQNADHYGVLNVPPHATREQVREAYYELARRYHPDRFRAGPLEDLRVRVEGYFSSVTEAYNTLYDTRLRAAYDEQRLSGERETPEQDTAYLARENFRRGMALVSKGRFKDAATSLENAVKQDGRNAQYRLELGRLLARNPRLRTQAEEQLIEVNRLDPSRVDGYFILGELYLKTDRKDQAIDLFHEVLRWEPDHPAASEHLRDLGAA